MTGVRVGRRRQSQPLRKHLQIRARMRPNAPRLRVNVFSQKQNVRRGLQDRLGRHQKSRRFQRCHHPPGDLPQFSGTPAQQQKIIQVMEDYHVRRENPRYHFLQG
jgi:hypothetical protein